MSNKKKSDESREAPDLERDAQSNERAAENTAEASIFDDLSPEKLRDAAERFGKEAEKLALELADERDKCLRLMAEYDNFRKRSQKERENIYTDVRGDTLLKFLPVFDNMERALKQETADEAYRKGVEMIMAQFKDILSAFGVAEIQANPGDKFDPQLHEALMHVEDASLGEDEIAEQFSRGFKLGDKVLRFSVVKVAN